MSKHIRSVDADSDPPPSLEALTPGLADGPPLPTRHPRPPGGPREWLRRAPLLQLLLYYAVLIAVGVAVALYSEPVRDALFSPVLVTPTPAGEAALLTGEVPAPAAEVPSSLEQVGERALATLVIILGALALVVPVARVYMQTHRFLYDPSLVRSVVILPIVVAGIAMVVKNSVALAFSLAGIVAAVRFRNTLKDPRDAVYIFLVIGIGLSAGVQALDVALVMSMLFNLVVLALWRFNIGSIYGGRYGETGVVSAGDSGLMVAHSPERRREIRLSLLDDAEDIKADGVLLVHTEDPELTRHTVQEALSETAKDWKLARVAPRDGRLTTLEYLIRLKKKTTATELVGVLNERWSAHVAATEYFWFRVRERERDGAPDDDDQ